MKRTQKILGLVLVLVFMAVLLPLRTHGASLPSDGCEGSEDGYHNWQPYDYQQYPTCTENGTYIYICMNCWETEVGPEGEIPALGHTWSKWDTGEDYLGTYHEPPTCTTAGEEYRSCSACDEIETRVAPALGHDWDSGTVTKEPTCTTAGVLTRHCSRCRETTTETLPAWGHIWDNGTVTKEATCTEEGVLTHHCARCNESETEAIPALGHDWDDGTTIEGTGFVTAQLKHTCRRCGEEKTESLAFDMAHFFASLRDLPFEEDTAPLVIIKEPEGGTITREPGDSLVLTVEVEGGSGEYSYEWHCETLDKGGKDTVLTAASLGLGKDLLESWAGTAKSWFTAHEDTFGDKFNQTWVQTITDATQTQTSLIDALDIFSHDVGFSESPEYEATMGNCEYWVEVTDSDGNTAVSQHVNVYYRIRIVKEPESVNWQADADEELQAVWLQCEAADGSGEYQYEWYWEGDSETPVDIHDTIAVTDLGFYVCYITDQKTGDVVKSQAAYVYSQTPLKIYSYTPSTTLWPDEEWTVQATVEFGQPPYTAWWDVDGDPLTTEYVGDDEQGRPIYEATGTKAGIYTFHVTDDEGAQATIHTSRIDQFLTIAKQPQGGTLAKSSTAGSVYVDLDVTMADGVAPYKYVLYYNGNMFVSRTSSNTTDGFRIYQPGVYYFIIYDSEGHWVQSDDAIFEYEAFHFTDYSKEASIIVPENGVTLSVTVSGGKAPYTYEWLESNGSGGWKTYGTGGASFTVRQPGFYKCKVTDEEGTTIQTPNIKVTYDGEAPLILTQPKSKYQGSAGEKFTLSCHAIPGRGQGGLVYDWYRTEPNTCTSWVWVGSGKDYTSTVPGIYKCIVTDTASDLCSTSDFAYIIEKLVITNCEIFGRSWVELLATDETWAYLNFTGGIGPYYVEVHKVGHGGNPDVLTRIIEIANVTYSSSKGGYMIDPLYPYEWLYGQTEDGTEIKDRIMAEYYFVLIDSYGQAATTEVLTVPELVYNGY